MTLFWAKATLASGAECQDALCPHTFKGKSVTLLVWWTEFVKSHPYSPSLQVKAFLWQWMKTKTKDERNCVLKKTKRPLQKGVQMWKAGKKKVHYTCSETGDIGKPNGPRVFHYEFSKIWGKNTFESSLGKKWQPGTENPFSYNVATLFRFQKAPGQTLHVKQIGCDALTRQQTQQKQLKTSQRFSLKWYQSTGGSKFTINGLF